MSLPIAELWSKFKSAIRFARTGDNAEAAVAVVSAAPAPLAEKVLITGSSTTSKPTDATAGANVEGIRTVNLYAYQADALATFTAELRVWGRAPGAWVALGDVTLSQTSGGAPPLDTEGYARVMVEIRSITASENVKFCVFPYNAEA